MAQRLATKAEVLAYAPALSAIDDGRLATIVAWTGTLINLERWRTKASHGHMLLAAHVGTKTAAGASSAAGPVVGKTLDKLSVSYAAPPVSVEDADLQSTTYGQQYLMLRRSLVIVPLTKRVCA